MMKDLFTLNITWNKNFSPKNWCIDQVCEKMQTYVVDFCPIKYETLWKVYQMILNLPKSPIISKMKATAKAIGKLLQQRLSNDATSWQTNVKDDLNL